MVLQFSPFEVCLAACFVEGAGEGLVGTHFQMGRQLAAGEAGQLTHVRAHHWEVLAGLKVGGQTAQRGMEEEQEGSGDMEMYHIQKNTYVHTRTNDKLAFQWARKLELSQNKTRPTYIVTLGKFHYWGKTTSC